MNLLDEVAHVLCARETRFAVIGAAAMAAHGAVVEAIESRLGELPRRSGELWARMRRGA